MALGWVLPDGLQSHATSCYYTTLKPVQDGMYQHVKRLWQLDVQLLQNEQLAVWSHLDQEAVGILEARTERVAVGDTLCYATLLFQVKNAPPLRVSVEAVMPKLHSTERRLLKAEIYKIYVSKAD